MQRLILATVCAGLTVGAVPAVKAEGVVESAPGNLVTEQLDIRGFSAIEVPGSWEIEVATGPFAVQVSVDENVRDDLRVELRGNTLRFGMRSRVGMFRRPTLRAQVSMPALAAVQVSGSGRVAATGFDAPALQVGVSGSGRVDAGGCRVGALDASVSGSGDINVEGCTVGSATVSISGSGGVALRGEAAACAGSAVSLRIGGSGAADLRGCTFADADISISGSGDGLLTLGTGDLTGSISGSGSITYRGAPTRVDVRTSGSGRVIKEG